MDALEAQAEEICRRLAIDDPAFVEIEAKRRVIPEDFDEIRSHLMKRKGVRHEKSAFFFDQFLDTPDMAIFKKGASMRLRYKKNGERVYLQYKGPGFRSKGILYRSEFSTERLRDVIMEESHHDIVHFSKTSVKRILEDHSTPAMWRALRRHLGPGVIGRITAAPLLCIYQKEKFEVGGGRVYLEPSLDRLFAFHVGKKAPHPLSTFCEFEVEIKAADNDLERKLKNLDKLEEFTQELAKKFHLPPEPLDKYHRSASFFLKEGR
ncbi:MAG: CYTH domain-containing protein [Elusimicrobia bacterium]|nr:CYTH domain-containing protein [Elusimicrobiota bacterium]